MKPIQPIKDGRFVENKIVRYLLDHGGIDLNQIAMLDFPQEDREQFAQLIGYSLNGFSELSYVTDETFETARLMYERGKTEEQAHIEHLQETLKTVREGMKQIVPALFRTHPDDLVE